MREKIISLTKKDFIVTQVAASSKGGQNANKTATKVTIVHPASGARATDGTTRSWLENRGRAFKKLAKSPRFRVWLAEVSANARQGKTIEQEVEESLDPKNLKWEVKDDNGRWTDGPGWPD